MPYSSTAAFILGTTEFNEQDKLVYLLTAEKGILKAIAPGACKVRNRFGSMLELLTEVEFVYYWNEEKELVTLSRGDLLNSNFRIVSKPENIFHFYLITEIITKFTPPHQKEPRIYKLTQAVLKNITDGIDIEILLLYFLIWILRIEGMMFKVNFCHNCFSKEIEAAWVKDNYRGILCGQCRTNEKAQLNQADIRFIQWSERHNPSELSNWLQKIDIPGLIRLFVRKIEHHGEFSLNCRQYLKHFK